MAKLTLEEKRLKALKLQLFGKEQNLKSVPRKISEKIHHFENPKQEVKTFAPPDQVLNMSYIKMDLLKILALVSLAISFQLVLYFATSHNIIKLNVFF